MSEVVDTENGASRRDTPLKRRLGLAADILFYAAAIGFFAYLSRYYMTGLGGPSLLAVTMVPMTLCIVVLNDLRNERFYEKLGPVIPWFIAAAYIAFSLYAASYLVREFDGIRITRMGIWSTHDLIVGAGMAALILEYTRRRYFVLFVINILLILYTVYGYLVPGLFNHPGMSWRRVASSISVEMSTGIFERMPQLGLTLIGSFILVLAVLRAFGCIDSILQGSTRLAMRSPTFLPQAAVIGSFGVFAWALWRGFDVDTARTMVVNTMVVMEIFYLFNVRYMHTASISWRGILGTPIVLAALAAVVAAQFAFTYAPFMHVLFSSRPVPFLDGLVIVGIGVALLLILEVEKTLMRRTGLLERLSA